VLKYLKKFLQNEWMGIQQTAFWSLKDNPMIRRHEPPPDEIITKDNYPEADTIVQEISASSNVIPTTVRLVGDHNNFTGGEGRNNIFIGRGNLSDSISFTGILAHELGHAKHSKFHRNISYLQFPLRILAEATTTLYGFGLMAYPFIGNNKSIDLANSIFQHGGKYIVPAIIVNAIAIRIREHAADLFGYKHTGILPSEYLIPDPRKGLLGNMFNITGKAIGMAYSGYPSIVERNLVCKLFGKPKETSFVEKINAQRAALKNSTHELPINK
jgi:hypothetical protein